MPTEHRLRPSILVSAAWIIPALFAAVDRIAQGRLRGEHVSARDVIWSSGDWFLYAFLTPAVFAVSRRFPLSRPHVARRVVFHLLMSLVFCVVWATAGKLLQFSLGMLFDAGAGRTLSEALLGWVAWIFTTLPFGIAVYLCVVGVEHATRYWVEARDREVQLARMSEQLTGARLAALQSQLNPHFLFNSLNTVTVLVRDGDNAAAARVIEQLSDVLRRTLNRGGTNEVPLEEELDLVRVYLAVEGARFSDRLAPVFDVDPGTLAALVPSFAVQHLVENAVRHGIAQRTNAGRVAIAARRNGDALEVSVTDDGPGVAPGLDWPNGHGLATTRERLLTLYGDRGSITLTPVAPHGTRAELRVPFKEVTFDSAIERNADR